MMKKVMLILTLMVMGIRLLLAPDMGVISIILPNPITISLPPNKWLKAIFYVWP